MTALQVKIRNIRPVCVLAAKHYCTRIPVCSVITRINAALMQLLLISHTHKLNVVKEHEYLHIPGPLDRPANGSDSSGHLNNGRHYY